MDSAKSRPELLVIVGETASGKSSLAIQLAKEFDGEIISADSWAVYKCFDVGTAKPSVADRRRIRHHLIDVAEPTDGFSAPKFKKMALSALKDIRSRNKLPIIVGGTGLYVDSLLFNYSFLPKGSAAERQRLDNQSLDNLLALAAEKGISLEGIDKRNKRRVIRAIQSRGMKPKKDKIMQGVLIVGLKTPPSELKSRIERRVDAMLKNGLEEEVRRLAEKFGWDVEPMQGIGYKEFYSYIEGQKDLDETRQLIIKNTMNLAKRQRTWFKRNQSIQWFTSPETAHHRIYPLLNT